jgi:mono/diheme cytochrome c family protein
VRRLGVPFALLGLGLVLSGCGTGGMSESSGTGNGQELFVEKCGSCHTLADAGTKGMVGPNLDDAFAAARKEEFEESTIREVVLGQMRFPILPMPEPDDPAMFPSSEYTDAERDEALEAIANYVASVAGLPAAAGAATETGAEGGEAAGDPQAVFESNCASCHTFAAAGTSGTIGPNLDESALDAAAIAEQIANGGGGMPPFEGQLSEEQIRALAQYLVENRGG